ncbi:MAG: DUF3568 family protein [Opitutales bacterium]
MNSNKASRWVRWMAVASLALAALGYSGCIAVVAAGAAGSGVAWYNGRMDVTLNSSLDDVYAASQKAVAQLEFARINESKSAVDASLVARTALDKKVEITLQKQDAKVTKLSIRVGVFGDENLSMTVLGKIKANL